MAAPSSTSCSAALRAWEAKTGQRLEDAEVVKLYLQIPPIAKLDSSLNQLKNCVQLSLSTNQIDRLIPLGGMRRLKILSLGRNMLKKIEKLDEVADTLEQLWLSYNQIATLDGLSSLQKLTTLYLSNNRIRSWSELDKLQVLPDLRDVVFVGNPIYSDISREDARLQVIARVPQVSKVDGELVTPAERETSGKVELL